MTAKPLLPAGNALLFKDFNARVRAARCVTHLVEELPANLKGTLPTPRDIEAELRKSRRTRRST